MKLENRCLVPADRATTWGLVMDVPLAAACVPGIGEVSAQEGGKFEAVMRVRVGPISLNLSGTIQLVEQDSEKGEARFVVEAADRRVGGAVKSNVAIRLAGQPDGQTELLIDSDTTFMGRLGELGQPIIRRKANTTLEEFARNLAQKVTNPTP
jgi:carbon monoxide dehydrogenase subunit G